MAFNEELTERVRKLLINESLAEKKMFGGIGFLLNGNTPFGVHGDKLIVRVGKERYHEILAHPSAKPFNLTGTAMTGWVEVVPSGVKEDQDLADWVHLGLTYARTLPTK
jgi:hypothetical protein